MTVTVMEDVLTAFEIEKVEEIAAPMEIVFETILEQMGPMNETPERAMPMVIEAWPGGRWYRDLGESGGMPCGHHWGVVQAIKAPVLLELAGPMFMSNPAVSNVQYRLSEENGVTTMRFRHRAMGWISEGDRQVERGWTPMMAKIREAALAKAGR